MLLLSEGRCNTSLPAQRNKNLKKKKTTAACEDMNWINFALDRVQCQTWDRSVRTAMGYRLDSQDSNP
jgi:hypothetical protein